MPLHEFVHISYFPTPLYEFWTSINKMLRWKYSTIARKAQTFYTINSRKNQLFKKLISCIYLKSGFLENIEKKTMLCKHIGVYIFPSYY